MFPNWRLTEICSHPSLPRTAARPSWNRNYGLAHRGCPVSRGVEDATLKRGHAPLLAATCDFASLESPADHAFDLSASAPGLLRCELGIDGAGLNFLRGLPSECAKDPPADSNHPTSEEREQFLDRCPQRFRQGLASRMRGE